MPLDTIRKPLRPKDELNAGAQPVVTPGAPVPSVVPMRTGYQLSDSLPRPTVAAAAPTPTPAPAAPQPTYNERVQNSPGVRAVRAVGEALGGLKQKRSDTLDAMGAYREATGGKVNTGLPTATAAAPAIAAPAAPAVAAPSFANVRGTPAPAPIARPAAPAPITPAAAGTSAQGAAAPAAGGGGSSSGGRVLGTFTGRNGTQTITEDSAAAMAGALPTSSGPVVADAAGNMAYSAGGGTTATGAIARPSLPSPSVPGVQGAVIGDGQGDFEAERQAALSQLNSTLEGIGPLRSRGKRQFAGELLQLRTGLTTEAGRLQQQDANAQLDARTRTNLAVLGEQGANARAEFGEAGQTDRTLIGERGQNARAELAQAGETFRTLNRPEYQADADGTVNRVQGGLARPVVGPDGKPLRTVTAQQTKAAEQRQSVLDNIAKTAVEFLPVGGQPSAEQIASARLQAAQIQGLQTATGPNGERGVLINGELVPL